MARQLNPHYIHSIISREQITGMAVVYLTGERFGVTTHQYRGWSRPGALRCAKCKRVLEGIPKEIIQTNHCPHCDRDLYPRNDKFLDQVGIELYRYKAVSYTALAACNFRQCIPGGTEHFGKYGGITAGYHKDHIFSVRDGFEEYVAEHIISAPINLTVTNEKRNLSKGRRSTCTLEELLAKYQQFEAEYPEWLERLARYEANQPTFVFD